MKKILAISLSAFLLLSLAGCTNNSEIEQLKKENEELKQQLANYNVDTDTTKNTNTSSNSNIPKDSTISFEYIDTSEFPDCLSNGVYRCGSDFEPGEFYILSLFADNAEYDISNSPDDFSYSSSRIIRKIQANEGQYVKLDYALLVPSTKFDLSNLKKYGIFTVGTDLPAGNYKIVPISNKYSSKYASVTGNLAAYQITSQTPFAEEVIECKRLHEDQTYITLTENQCITINNAYLVLVEN